MNDPQDPMIRSIARLRQDPQSVARAMADARQRVIGYAGDDVPVELIIAAGAVPVRLCARADELTHEVDRYVETSFTPQSRAIAAQWLAGGLDHLAAVVFSRGDDSSQRLYYYLCELQRCGVTGGPRPLLFDVANLPRDASLEHTLDSTRLLASQLGVDVPALGDARARVRARAALLHDVDVLRTATAPLAGSLAWGLERAAACNWRPQFDAELRAWLERAPRLNAPRRLLLAGDPPPDDRLHLLAETHGATIVLELTSSRAPAAAPATAVADPLAAIADDCRLRESPALAMRRDPRWLAGCARAQRVDRVIVWASEQNEALPWEVARQMRELQAAHVPALLLARQSTRTTDAALTRFVEFIREPGGSS